MAFPPGDIAVLDNANRADGPAHSGRPDLWSNLFIDGSASTLVIDGNAFSITGSDGGALTLEDFSDGIRILPIKAASNYVAFAWRVQNPGTSSAAFYAVVAAGLTWTLRKYTAPGAFTTLDSYDVESSPSALDRLGILADGSTQEVYLYRAGAWNETPILSAVDSSYASGPCAFWFGNSSVDVEEYIAGELAAPTEPVTIHVDADHPDASDSRTRIEASNPDTPFLTPNAACAIARATPTWRDIVLIKRSTLGNADPSNLKDPDLYPQLDHRWTNRSETAPGWLFGDNTGNLPIVVRGDVPDMTGASHWETRANIKAADLPKIYRFQSRELRNWRFERLQGGYDVSSDAARAAGTGHDFSTLSSLERVQDVEFEQCHFTGGLGILAHWGEEFRVTDCVVHSPLPPDGGNPGFQDGAGLKTERSPNDSLGGFSVGQIYLTRTEFSNVRGQDAVTVGGVFDTDPQYETFDMVIDQCVFWNVTEGNNPAFHTDSIQALSVPRCRVINSFFVGNATSFMASDGRNGLITLENNLVVAAGSPFQIQGTDEIVIRHNTFFHTTPLVNSTLLFYDRTLLPENTLATIQNNIIGGFFMRDRPIASYFRAGSVIDHNIVISSPGLVTPFGANLEGISEFGNSARLSPIPNLVFEAPGMTGEPTLTLARTWELSNTPVASPGIGQGIETDITHDIFGRAYANPPDVGCLQSSGAVAVTPIARAPYIISRVPTNGAISVSPSTAIQIVLYPKPGASINPSTVNSTNFYLMGPNTAAIPVDDVDLSGPDELGRYYATITLAQTLLPWVVYSARATTAIQDSEGSPLAQTENWSFRVAGNSPSTRENNELEVGGGGTEWLVSSV